MVWTSKFQQQKFPYSLPSFGKFSKYKSYLSGIRSVQTIASEDVCYYYNILLVFSFLFSAICIFGNQRTLAVFNGKYGKKQEVVHFLEVSLLPFATRGMCGMELQCLWEHASWFYSFKMGHALAVLPFDCERDFHSSWQVQKKIFVCSAGI